MPLTPEDVQNKRFTTTRLKAGYDEDEVDGFLDEVEAEMRRLLTENGSLRSAAAAAASAPPVAAPAAAPAPVAPAEDLNETALRTLTMAQRTAEEAIAQAQAEADQVLTAARLHASSIERDAKAEHVAKISEFERAREAIEAQLGDLRGFERDHLTRVRAYLESQLKELEILESAASPLLSTPTATSRPAAATTAPSSSVSAPGHAGVPVPAVSSSVPATAPSAAPGGPGGPFSTAPLPASPQDSPELFTPPSAPATSPPITATTPPPPVAGPAAPAAPASVPLAPRAEPPVVAPPSAAGFATDVDADSDVPSGPPAQADEGDTDDAEG